MEWNPKFLPMSSSKREKQTNKQKNQKVKYQTLKVMEKTSLTPVHIKTEKKKSKVILKTYTNRFRFRKQGGLAFKSSLILSD